MNAEQIKIVECMSYLLTHALDRSLFYKFSKKLNYPVNFEKNPYKPIYSIENNDLTNILLSMQSNHEKDFNDAAVAFAETIFSTVGHDMLYHDLFNYLDPNLEVYTVFSPKYEVILHNVNLIYCMDRIMRHLNNEDIFIQWIQLVPDDINWGDESGFEEYNDTTEDEFRKIEETFFNLMKLAGLDDGSEFGKDLFKSNKTDLDFNLWIWVKEEDYRYQIDSKINLIEDEKLKETIKKFFDELINIKDRYEISINTKDRANRIIGLLNTIINSSMTEGVKILEYI